MIFDLPQVPFEVYYKAYNKTVYVVSSCIQRTDGMILDLGVNENGDSVTVKVYKAIDKAFDSPGITKVIICRK